RVSADRTVHVLSRSLNPDFGNEATLTTIEAAVARCGVKAMTIVVRSRAEIEPAIDAFAAGSDGGIIPVPPVTGLPSVTQVINRLALRHRLPTIYSVRMLVAEGGLMSYGADVADLFRRGAPDYVECILRGAKPGELPVQFSTKFELVINMKTAKAIRLTTA